MSRQGLEERNIARLNPVLALNRIPEGMTGWHKTVEIDNLGTVQLACIAASGHTVPHGLDADVVFGLLTSYELQGRPADRFLQLRLDLLCQYIGLQPGGQIYPRLRQSLERLTHTTFYAESCWGEERNGTWKWQSKTFRIVDSLTFKGEGAAQADTHRFQATTEVEVSLGREILHSIGLGHTRHLDLEFYWSLSSPLTRLLYRVIEEQKALCSGKTFVIDLKSWGEHLGLRELVQGGAREGKWEVPATRVFEPRRIRRALDPAHSELLQRGYFKDVTYLGSAAKQRVLYTFGDFHEAIIDLETVALLTTRGVTHGRATELAHRHGRERIAVVARQFDARLAAGYTPRNKAGLLCDMLESPDRYQDSETAIGKAPVPPNKPTMPASILPAEPELASNPRDARTAHVLLGSTMLKDSHEGREVVEQLAAAYVAGHCSALHLIEVARLEGDAAFDRARELLDSAV